LSRTAKAYSYSKIAIAHNKDDQIETFLHRLLRGAGLKGLKGISPRLEVNGIQIIRPIIECWREEIESYLRKRKLPFCIDVSNYETKFTRNKIRHQLLPYLIREYNPNLKEVLEDTIENIQSAYDYIEEQLENEFKRCVKKNSSCVKIKIGRLKKVHPYLKSEIIRKAIEVVKGNLRRLEYRHFKEIESLLSQRPVGAVVNLPQGVWARKEKDWLVIERKVKDGGKR
jgi:tRNA(Ile)-lysidine synthase